MTTSSKPRWFRLETDLFESVKIATLRERKAHESIALWLDGLAYAVRNLTDGYVPAWLPKRHGFRPSAIEPLLDVVLWIPAVPLPGMEIQGFSDGWLIHDYAEYQPTKAHWQAIAEQRRAAALERWSQ